MRQQRVVIVGAGIAGLLLATRLGERLGKAGRAHISLVDSHFTHVWKPLLHSLAAGTRDVNLQRISLLAHASGHGHVFEPGALVSVDREARRIQLGPLLAPDGRVAVAARELPYDWLVLALGSGIHDFGTPGVQEHAHAIDGQAQAERFNAALRSAILRAALQDTEVRVAIVGAGATGVQLAAELSELMEHASGFGDARMRRRLRLSLYESSPRVLAAFPEAVAMATHHTLTKLGFEVHTGMRVQAVTAGSVQLPDGQLHHADLTVWAAGIKAPDVLAHIPGLTANRAQQLQVLPCLQTTGDERILALGDCASLQLPDSEHALPPTAQVATQQAEHLARHLPALLQGRALPDFRHRDLGTLVSLARYGAYGTLGRAGVLPGHFLAGRVAQLGHAWLYQCHRAGVQGWGRASVVWLAEQLQRLAMPPIRMS